MMTKLPESVPIGDEVFEVQPVYRARYKSDGIWVVGDVDVDKKIIRIAVGSTRHPLPVDWVWATVYHEILHALDHVVDEVRANYLSETMNHLNDSRSGI